MLETAARRTATRVLWLGVKNAAANLFSRWVWGRRLSTKFVIVMLQVSWREYAKCRYIGDHCEAERIYRRNERLSRWLREWSWFDWKGESHDLSWLSNPKIESWTDFTAVEPIEQQKLPDIEVEVNEKYPDGEVHAVRRKATLVDAWVTDAPASQHGGMTLHMYDGPSLTEKLMKDGSLRQPPRQTTGKEFEMVNVISGVDENTQLDIDVSGGEHVDLSGIYIGHGLGEVTLIAHDNDGINYWISFKADSAKRLGENIVLAAEKAGAR